VSSLAADQSTDALLLECLEQSPELRGRIARLDRKRLDSSTSYETSALTLHLNDGRQLRVFLKDFGHSVRPKDDPQMRREREMRFYRDLAPQGELGTPRYFGSVWEPAAGRQWLLIEFVQGTPVRYCEFEHWPLATAMLGKMHGHFSRDLKRLEACEFLARHDSEFFMSKARRSLDAVRRTAPAEGERLADALRDYERVVETMLNQPRTLLHGGYRPINVLIKIDGDPQRTCVIDWEEAGLGAPLSDLAYFVDGFKDERLELLLNEYRGGAEPYDLPLPKHDEMIHVINCFRLHKLVHSLQKYVQWNVPAETVVRLVNEVTEYAAAARE
jgi:aminoglycoside phosphotransferase (APT) family kinase protein